MELPKIPAVERIEIAMVRMAWRDDGIYEYNYYYISVPSMIHIYLCKSYRDCIFPARHNVLNCTGRKSLAFSACLIPVSCQVYLEV